MIRFSTILAAGFVALLAPTPVRADLINLDPSLFGDLKQSDTFDCPDSACGPVAAVNSFVFLQNRYAEIYGASLVGVDFPNGHPPPKHFETLAADILAGTDYMGTCACGGTPIEKFIVGKQRYIEDHIAGKTVYEAEIAGEWRPDVAGTTLKPVEKPGYVADRTAPTLAFITQELRDREDVEIFFDYLTGTTGSHYVTLTGINTDDDTIKFIDPTTGTEGEAGYSITEVDLGGFLGKVKFIDLAYADPTDSTNFLTARVTAAVSESPVPELSSVALLFTGLVAVGLGRLRSRYSVSGARPGELRRRAIAIPDQTPSSDTTL